MEEKLYELAVLLQEEARKDGLNETGIANIKVFKASSVTEALHTVYEPSLFIIAQGAKRVMLGSNTYCYDASSYLVSSMNLPISGQIIEASLEKPFLSMQLCFTPEYIFDLASQMDSVKKGTIQTPLAMSVHRVSEELIDAILRLAKLFQKAEDSSILAPLIIKEILYRLLQGEYGVVLRQFALHGSNANRIAQSIELITSDISEPLHVGLLSQKVGMSVSAFHKHFKYVTAMSPLQYQKQLRLQKARELLVTKMNEVGEVAYNVGYESPSQFSREYTRFFGLSPQKDLMQFKREIKSV
ncbi:AraC family transcriptional regulator [Sulfurospirillum diekertiae]|uniref:Regulatory protein PchR n=1 Tax=Sulfurospirillum diekertiae TaxID=1854492 RepID=A0A1Y0HJD0_9BACT|nr:AraC family transcriptional regulator [Sulfurospirillum diekertiae]ARU47514.1 Regulatory protein PchR [Sulfurospirillum diekertiae]ASC92362.1 Regulatory protein PchR [Sulfurospirillum diekertiae]